MALDARGHLFLGGGLRLQLRDIAPAGVLAGSCAAIDVAVLDFQKGFGAQAGEKLADARLHAGLRERLLDLLADLLEAGLAGLEALVNAQDDEALGSLERVRDVALLLLENDVLHVFRHEARARTAAAIRRCARSPDRRNSRAPDR